jgi:hypothetical protein
MGTNALIGVVNTDNTVTTSYVHYDGYIDGVGGTLLKHYNDDVSSTTICNIGYASSLEPTVEETEKNAVHEEDTVEFDNIFSLEEYVDSVSNIEYVYLRLPKIKKWMVRYYSDSSSGRLNWVNLKIK